MDNNIFGGCKIALSQDSPHMNRRPCDKRGTFIIVAYRVVAYNIRPSVTIRRANHVLRCDHRVVHKFHRHYVWSTNGVQWLW